MNPANFLTIQTPECVTLTLERAGIASRVLAFLIDMMLICIIIAGFVFSVLQAGEISAEWSETLLRVGVPFLLLGTPWLFEWWGHGQSPGKRLFRIRVVRNDGLPIGVWEAFGRNLLRILDLWLLGIGLIPMLTLPQQTRLGDILAGTNVIRETGK